MSSNSNPFEACVYDDEFMATLHEQLQHWQILELSSGERIQKLQEYCRAYEAMQRVHVDHPALMRPCDPAEFRTILVRVMGMQDVYNDERTPLIFLHDIIYPAQPYTKLMYTEEQLPELARVMLTRLDRIRIDPAFVPAPTQPIVVTAPPPQVFERVDRQLTDSIDVLLSRAVGSQKSGAQIVKAFAEEKEGLETYESLEGTAARKELADLGKAMRNSRMEMMEDDEELQAAILASMMQEEQGAPAEPEEDSMDTLD
jgi:hypothetical protein